MTFPRLRPIPPQPASQVGRPHLNLLAAPASSLPHVEVFRNAALSIPNGFAFTNLAYDSVDDGALVPAGFNTATGVYTCPLPGRYLVVVFVIFNVAGTYTVGLELVRNGAAYKRLATGQGTNNVAADGSTTARALTAGTTFQIQVAQSSATNPGPLFTGQELCYASFEYLGPLL